MCSGLAASTQASDLPRDEAAAAVVADRAQRWSHLLAGSMRKFRLAEAPAPPTDTSFATREGPPRSLADFKGKVVLVNFWATWCLPCREEMPLLERLRQRLGADGLEVVAVSVDRPTVDAAAFLHNLGARSLTLLLDPGARTGARLGVVGLPTSILLDRDGRVVGRLQGSADWGSDDAVLLLKAVLLDRPAGSAP